MRDQISRRQVLQALAAASTVTLSGCASIVRSADSSPDTSSTPGEESTDANSPLNSTETLSASQNTSERGPQTDQLEQSEAEADWSIDDLTINTPSTQLSPVPLPDEETRYPQMGAADDVATLYGNWKCPYTREFVLTQLPSVIEEHVRPGDLSIRFRSVAYRGAEPFLGPDAPAATHAGLGVWETDPDSFWDYFTYVFANQPQERYEWAQPSVLARFARRADVQRPDHIAQMAADEVFSNRVQETVESANTHDIWTVPRIRYDDTVTAPTVNPERTREQLD